MSKKQMFVFGIFLALVLSLLLISSVSAKVWDFDSKTFVNEKYSVDNENKYDYAIEGEKKDKEPRCNGNIERHKKCNKDNPVEIINLTSCQDLNESGRTYVLQNDINNYDGTCFSIIADNIVFDGNGYTITGTNNVYEVYWGVLAEGRNNVTIRNLTINNFGDTYLDYDTTDDGGAVKLLNTNWSYIYSVSTSGDNTGISLENSYNNELLSLNSFNDYRGIKLVNSLYNSFEGSSLGSSGADLVCSHSDVNFDNGLVYSTQYGCESWITLLLRDCGILNQNGGNYKLMNDISNQEGTCFEILADNVILDGNGYTITGTNNENNVYWGVYAENVKNISVKDLTINNFGDITCTGVCDGGGIRFYNVNNSYINYINTSIGNNGINFDYSYYNSVSSVNVLDNAAGLVLVNSEDNSFSGSFLNSVEDLFCITPEFNINEGIVYGSQYGCDWVII